MNSTVPTSIVGIAGGALAGYIGQALLKAQEIAPQLRTFSSTTPYCSRLLAAERFVDQVPENQASRYHPHVDNGHSVVTT